MKKALILVGIASLLTGAVVEAQQRKAQSQRQQQPAVKYEEVIKVLKSGFPVTQGLRGKYSRTKPRRYALSIQAGNRCQHKPYRRLPN